MESPDDMLAESALPDSKNRCTVCKTTADDKYNGQYWCQRHLEQRLAREY